MRYLAVVLLLATAACSETQSSAAQNGLTAAVPAQSAGCVRQAANLPPTPPDSMIPGDASAGVHRDEALSDSPIGSGDGNCSNGSLH